MKVLLINPPIDHLLTVGLKAFTGKRGFFPAMGMLYVAAYSRFHTDHDVKALDAPLEAVDYNQLEDAIRKHKPDIVGISVMTFTLLDSIRTARLVKKIFPHVPVVFGGIHATIFPRETILLKEVDYVVRGEGEMTFAELLNCFGDRDSVKRIGGLLYKENGNIIDTGPRPLVENLDHLPFPARELTSYQHFYSLENKCFSTTLITSRGCPYRCIFCIRSKLLSQFRPRSPKNVIDEIKHCMNLGFYEFSIWDDTFTLDRQRVLDICNRIIEEKLVIKWSVMTRVDKVDQELIKKMKQAGCTRIRFGNESGSAEILKVLRKGIVPEQIREAFRITRAEGMSTVSFFMIGAPQETLQHIKKTLKLAKSLNASFTNFSIVTLYPGTELYELALKKGILKRDVWRDFARRPDPDFVLPLWEENFSRDQLIRLQARAYRSYYFRPLFLIRKLFQISTWRGFKEIWRNGLSLIASTFGKERQL